MTWLAENGFALHVADRLLNHVQGKSKGVAAVYQRGEFLAERARALDAWASHLVAVESERLVALSDQQGTDSEAA